MHEMEDRKENVFPQRQIYRTPTSTRQQVKKNVANFLKNCYSTESNKYENVDASFVLQILYA